MRGGPFTRIGKDMYINGRPVANDLVIVPESIKKGEGMIGMTESFALRLELFAFFRTMAEMLD